MKKLLVILYVLLGREQGTNTLNQGNQDNIHWQNRTHEITCSKNRITFLEVLIGKRFLMLKMIFSD